MKYRKLLSLALSAALTLGTAAPAAAAGANTKPVEGENSTYIPTVEEAQTFVTDKGWMTGTDKGFEPERTVDRATIYEMFWKMEGSPVVDEPSHLGQWNESMNGILGVWYTNSARWAYSVGLTTGTNEGYQGERTVTRAEVLTILHRYMSERLGLDVSVEGDWSLEVFEDAGKIQPWAETALRWGWLSGVACQLDTDPTLDPDAPVSRIELAQMLTVMGRDIQGQTADYVEETVSYENDGRTVPAVVTLPKGAQGTLPLVVLAHGHGGGKDEGTGFIRLAQALAAAGIASIRMDFPGCGDSTEPFTENTLSNMNADVKAGLVYMTEHYDVDGENVGILGYSMGGRIALEVATEKDSPFQAVYILSGVSTPASKAIPIVLPEGVTASQAEREARSKGSYDYTTQYGQNLSLSAEWFTDMKVDPLANIKNFDGAMVVVHGDADDVVDDETNKLTVSACPAAREIIVPGSTHGYGFYGFDIDGVYEMVEETAVGFFSLNLKGAVEGRAVAASKYGNISTDITLNTVLGAGFEVGDILTVNITGLDEALSLPYGTGYSNVDQGSPLALNDASAGTLAMAINRGDFATTYGLGVKDAETATYTMDAAKTLALSMGEKGGYLEEMEIRELDSKRTNVREDYASDEVFANFRAVTLGDIAEGRLYRTSSPVNPELGRNTYADAFLKEAGVKTVVNLADSKETMEGYEGYAESCYATLNVIPLNMGVDMYSADAIANLKAALQYMLANEGPYAFHCTEGKDRAGYFAMVLEALMGADLGEIVEDYMLSFENYYHVEYHSEQWTRIAQSNIIKDLMKLTGAETEEALAKADLVKAAETYLEKTIGLTAAEIQGLKDALSK